MRIAKKNKNSKKKSLEILPFEVHYIYILILQTKRLWLLPFGFTSHIQLNV